MPKYQERDVLNKHLEELKQEQFAIDSEIRKWQTEEQKLNDRIEALRAQEEVLRGKPEELHTLKMAEAKRKVLADKMKAVLEMQLPRYHKLDVDYRAVQPYYTDARHNYEVADNVYQDAERTLEGCRAGLLAQNLKEGKMCPVCGSLHHPQPAVLPSETVTEEELKKLKAERDKLCEIKDNALAKVEKAKAQYEQYEGQFVQALLDCLADAGGVNQIPTESVKDLTTHVQSAYAAIQAKLKEDAAFISSLEQACRVLEQTRDALDIAQTHDKEQLISSKALLDQKKQNVQSELAADSATLRTLQNLSYPDFETAKRTAKAMSEKVDEITKGIQRAEEYKKYVDSQVDQLSGMLTTLKKTLEEQKADETELKEQLQRAMLHTAFSTQEEMRGFVTSEEDIAKTEEEINNYQQDVATNNEGLKQAEMDAAGKRWVDVESLETICQEQTEANAIKQKIVNEIENRIHNNREKHNNIQVQRGLYESAEKENNICNRLYNLVKGTTVNGKITLEQYIQAAGFDGIIAAANRRLLPMSDGQYELYRQEGPLGKRSNTFLDLEVLDNYTGHRRPVGNLSGGESFKASLSLALGLSDTVSSNLGGIQMDALFIDEGFGTLDRKSIDSAMDILNNLSGANKLVGVISHREELVENISQQIRVKKTKDGSNFSVELGL
jgi:exonuclease SbcC